MGEKSGKIRSTPGCVSSGKSTPQSTMRILPSNSYEVMLRPISPSPPIGITRRVPCCSAGGSNTSELGNLFLACGAGDLGKRATRGGVTVGAEVGEVDTGHVVHERDLIFDEGGLRLFGADEGKAHTGARDATESVQDVLRRDGARHMRHHGAHERLERLVSG